MSHRVSVRAHTTHFRLSRARSLYVYVYVCE